MNFDSQKLITLFLNLRSIGLNLGVGELLAAIKLFKDETEGIIHDGQRGRLRQLWCKSSWECIEFDTAWENHLLVPVNDSSLTASELLPEQNPLPLPNSLESSTPSNFVTPDSISSVSSPSSQIQQFELLPVKSPFIPIHFDQPLELNTFWPVSRRSMIYSWKYLDRWVADGPADILDLEDTVKQVACTGFFLSPVFKRRERNITHLLLLVDVEGSMMPFHQMSRDLVETAQTESEFEQVDVLYFHNLISSIGYQTSYLTQPVVLEEFLQQCFQETYIFVVSDAGAARGYRRIDRLFETTRFLNLLKKYSSCISWLNPVPAERWNGTSAEFIARQVSMFQMDSDGLNAAIDTVRGQRPTHFR